MADERRQEVGPTMQAIELLDHHLPQFPPILGREVRQPPELGVPPHRLVGIGLRGIAGQRLGDDLGMLRQVGPHDLGVVGDITLVPEDRPRPGDVAAQLLQERDDVLAVDIDVVGPQAEVQAQPLAFGADGDDAEGRDAVVPVPALEDRVWPLGAKVRRTVGVSRKPASSRKTKGAPRNKAFGRTYFTCGFVPLSA